MRPDATLVVHTTGSPVTSARLDEATRARGCHSLDVPVSGSAGDIEAGSLTLLAGGDAAVLERCRSALSTYGDPILHVGGVGDGQRVKLVNNALLAAHLELARRAVAMGDALGIDARTLAGAVIHGSGASRAMAMMASADSPRELLHDLREFLAKDLDVIERVAGELGLDLGEIGSLAAAAVRSDGVEPTG
jgi:3-hydroxyisobutyrate dehydrogenase-like beta-hydroxyacid dehydrogenase